MPRYFHVQRSSASSFRVGKSYRFGTEANFFSRDLFSMDPMVPVAGTDGLPIDFLLRDYFDPTGFRHYRKIRSKIIGPNEDGLLKAALSVLTQQAMAMREFVFETVRLEFFSNKPSRLKGMWLIPYDMQLLAQWCATAPQGQFRAFEVEADGNFHCGYSGYLAPGCVGVEKLRTNARRYWSEVPRDPVREATEFLFEGEVRVLRVVEMPGSQQAVWTKLKKLFG